jgi:hypothetical protein
VAARPPTRHRHWRRVGSRAAADESDRTSRSGSSSSSLSSYAGGEGHRRLQQRKQRTTTIDFNSFVLQICFSGLVFFFCPLFLSSSPMEDLLQRS